MGRGHGSPGIAALPVPALPSVGVPRSVPKVPALPSRFSPQAPMVRGPSLSGPSPLGAVALAIPGPLPIPGAPPLAGAVENTARLPVPPRLPSIAALEPPSNAGVPPAVSSSLGSVPPPSLSDPLVLTKIKPTVAVLPGLEWTSPRDSSDALAGLGGNMGAMPSAESPSVMAPEEPAEAEPIAPIGTPNASVLWAIPGLEAPSTAPVFLPSPVADPAATMPFGLSDLADLAGMEGVLTPASAPVPSGTPAASVHANAPPAPSAPPPPPAPDPATLRIERLSDFPVSESLAELASRDRRKRHRGIHPVAWGLIAMCAALGGVLAWIFLFPSPVAPPTLATGASSSRLDDSKAKLPLSKPPALSDPQKEPRESDSAAPVSAPVPGGPAVALAGALPLAGAPGLASAGRTAPEPDKSVVKAAAPCDPRMDPLCSAVGGPDAPGGATGSGESNGGLTPDQLSATVNRNRGGVQRGCMPLVQAGAVKVTVTLTIGPSGGVSAVSTSGGSGNSAVVGCIRSKVSGWHFPSSGGTTQVSVPFQLIAQ